MKHYLLKNTLLLCAFLGSLLSYGQVQQHVWYLENQEIDFTTAIPTPSTVSASFGAGCTESSNNSGQGIHDANGNLILSICGGQLFTQSGSIGVLDHWEWEADNAIIIPKPGASCGYYVVYNSHLPFPSDGTFYCPPDNGIYHNTFYAEVELSSGFGSGSIVSNGNVLQDCDNASASPLAATLELTNGNRYMYRMAPYYANVEIQKYLVSPTGIALAGIVHTGTLLNDVKPTEMEVSHDGTMIAVADHFSDKVYIFHVNPVTGNLVPTAGNMGDGTSVYTIPSSTNELSGLEFSPNGDNLYVASRNDGIVHIDLGSGVVSSALAGSTDYGNSQLELGYDPSGNYKIYAVSTTPPWGLTIEDMGVVDDPDGTPSFIASYVSGVSAYDFSVLSANTYFNRTRLLPNQIDGEDYVARFDDATGSCCASLEGFDTEQYTATSNGTWEPGSNPFGGLTVVRVAEEIRIPSGRNIHIKNMEFKFNDDAKLVIEPGARLTLTNSTLTSMDCEGLMWDGVELQGNYLVDQTPFSQQGYLYMQSNSEISNAINGINVFGTNVGGGVNWSQTGGIVRANNSTFRNNIRDVQYLSYGFKNYGSFSNCTFITDAAIKNGGTVSTHVSMYHVDGVSFYGNDFLNTTTGLYPATSRGRGIRSIEAKYKVTYRCTALLPFGTPCPDADKDGNLFEGLYYGIEANSANPFYTIDVRYNTFNDNVRGVYFGGVDYSIVVNNDFNVAEPVGDSYGLYLDNCTGYQVENNNFMNTHAGATYGTIINNSNAGGTISDANEIYHNSYDGFYMGAAAINANVQMVGGNPVVNTGLTFKCNDFSNSQFFDILILFGGVSPFQGSCMPTPSGDPHAQANNIFSDIASTNGDFWNANSTVFQMDYRFEDGMPMYLTEPRSGLYNLANTTLTNCGTFDLNISCPENRFDKTGGLLSAYLSFSKKEASLLTDRIDGAQTASLLAAINSSLPENQLKSQLLAVSPYLSDPVLIAALSRTPALTETTVVDIVLANSPVSSDVMDQLQSLNLTRNAWTSINNAQVGVSAMTDLLSDISFRNIEAGLAFNELTRRYLHDTIIVDGEDSVRTLLEDNITEASRMASLSSLLIKQGSFEEAQDLLSILRQTSGYSDFCDYQEILISLESDISKAYVLEDDRDLKRSIKDLSNKTDGSKESMLALAHMRQVFDRTYDELIPTYSSSNKMEYGAKNEGRMNVEEILIHPNPATNLLNIELLNVKEEAVSDLQLFDLGGRLVLQKKINGTETQLQLDAMKSGVYLLIVESANGTVSKEKLVIQH
jgi:hypothetical protein